MTVAADDEAGPVRIGFGFGNGVSYGIQVEAIHVAQHLPPVSLEAARHVFRKAMLVSAFDGDFVVVIDEDELAQPQGSGQRSRFRDDAFLQIAVGYQGIGVGWSIMSWPGRLNLAASQRSARAMPTALPIP